MNVNVPMLGLVSEELVPLLPRDEGDVGPAARRALVVDRGHAVPLVDLVLQRLLVQVVLDGPDEHLVVRRHLDPKLDLEGIEGIESNSRREKTGGRTLRRLTRIKIGGNEEIETRGK